MTAPGDMISREECAEICDRAVRERTAECMRLVCPGWCAFGVPVAQGDPDQGQPPSALYHERSRFCAANAIRAAFPEVQP